MDIRGRELTYPRLLLVAVLLVTLSVLVVAVGTSSAVFSSYNYEWDGSSDLRTLADESGADVHDAHSTAAYRHVDSDHTTGFVLGPTDSYAESEVKTMTAFIESGGTLVVAADGGAETNRLLEGLGVESEFDGRQLRDEQRFHRSPALPIASPVAESTLTQDVSQITLNHGTAVSYSDNATILANSSAFSYLDTNANAELDDDEPVRQYPVIVREEHGNGSVVLISDASILINTMLERSDNRQLAVNLLADSETVLFDYSNRDGIPSAVAFIHTGSDVPAVQWLVVAVLVIAAGIAWGRSAGRPDRFDPD